MRGIVSDVRAIALLACGLVSSAAYAKNLTVNCPSDRDTYPTISDAVGALTPSGGTIVVCPGSYDENVVIPYDHVTLKARTPGSAKLTLSGPPSSGIELDGSDDVVDGFYISTFSAGISVGAGFGHETIQNNNLISNGVGISFQNSLYNVVKKNQIWNNATDGISDVYNGMIPADSANQYIDDDVQYNANNGVYINTIASSPPCAEARASITGTIASNNGADGVQLNGSDFVTVKNDALDHNGQDGIELISSNNNTIKNNNADSNGANATDCGPAQGGGNCVGFRVHSTCTDNTLNGNSAHENLVWDAQDNSSGSGTAGTGNTWKNDLCTNASPAGICR